jgi:site-specific recombinase XerD
VALIEQQNIEQEVYFNFINSLKSPVTKQVYKTNINYYLKFCDFTKLSELLTIHEPDKQIIKYIMSLRNRALATNSIDTRLSAIYHFYTMNDITLNKKKIRMFIGEPTLKVIDKPYNHEQIQKILDVSDLRWKCIVLLLCSSGCRIGALAQLRLRNLEKIESCYKIVFYEGSKEQYYSFCSPECVTFIDTYLEFRNKNAEKLDQDSFLIRDQFDINDLKQIRNSI